MTASRTIIVVGGGQAGLQATSSLRDAKFAGRILLIGEEPDLPYQRPPLSKAYIEGSMHRDALPLRSRKFFDDKVIEFRAGEPVAAIERADRKVRLRSGECLAYDHLVLATGTRNRLLSVAGCDLDGVAYLRTVTDAKTLKTKLALAKRLVIIGAGFIGLEVAALARKRGIETTVLDVAPRPMARAVSYVMSDYFLRLHTASGVAIRCNAGVTAIDGVKGKVAGVALDTGEHIAADLVLIGIGALPNIELAAAAQLAVDNGIVVDDVLTTSDPDISAIGDCAAFPFWIDGGRLRRLESVQNAVDQGRSVAAKLTGQPKRYANVPWFWSDQGDTKLQIVGLTAGHDEVLISGEMSHNCFSVFCFKNRVLVGIESINRPADHMAGRRLLRHDVRPSPKQVIDFKFDVKALEAHLHAVSLEACS